MSIRQDYDVPRRASLGLRMWAVMAVLPVLALVLWIVAPGSAIAVAVLAILLLAIVFGGVAWAMSSRDLRTPPGRHPQQPPSAS